jgi:hypothetical protein
MLLEGSVKMGWYIGEEDLFMLGCCLTLIGGSFSFVVSDFFLKYFVVVDDLSWNILGFEVLMWK